MLIDGNIMSLFLSRNFRNGEHRTYLATISNLFLYTYTLGYVYKIVKNVVDIITHILLTRWGGKLKMRTYPVTLAPVLLLDPARMIPMIQWPTYSMVYKFVLSNMRILAWIVDRLWGNCIHLWVYKVYKMCQTQNVREDVIREVSFAAFGFRLLKFHAHTVLVGIYTQIDIQYKVQRNAIQ